ncbi:MAG TPA: hypothetical protein VFL31_04635 [Nitrospiraceae bacterium]|nr:hypothetical protein [Nitrospiraceae bacterium]
MATGSPISDSSHHPLAALLSALLPGLGHTIRRRPGQAAITFVITATLLSGAWGIGNLAGSGAAIFFLMLLVLPWWAFQSYDAFLPRTPAQAGLARLNTTLKVVWARGHDIRYLGALFLLTAFTDLYIIAANPEYALTIFCTKPAGQWGALVKAQSPTLHTLIGYGFMRLRRWSLVLYLAYAAFGLLNATANYACFGYGRVRTVFLLTLIAFTAYVLWRRRCFDLARASCP